MAQNPRERKKRSQQETPETEILGPEDPSERSDFEIPEVELAPITEREDGLATYDPLQRYIDEIRRYPLLDRETEHKLAVRYRENQDPTVAARLVTSNLRLVVKIAHEYRRAYKNLLDLIQEGNLGLMQAVKKYDPYKNVKLSSYSAWWIRAYILKFILNNFRLVRVGTTQAQRKLFFNLRKEQERLEALGIDVSPRLLAENLSVKEDEVREMQERLAGPEFSLDAPIDSNDSDKSRGRHVDLIPDQGPRAEEQVANAEFQERLSKILQEFAQTLNEKEKIIYQLRLLAEEPLTLQEIGDKFGVSRERARQLEKRIIDKARVYFKEKLGQDFEFAVKDED